MKATLDLRETAAITRILAKTSISCIEDVWSPTRITLEIKPENLVKLKADYIKEIVMRCFTEYLKRPGHVSLPDGLITAEDFEKERNNPILRAQLLWMYWHGTQGLGLGGPKTVSQV